VSHVAFVLVEQAVEADRSVVLRRAAERAEAEAGIKAGFTHGAIPAIEAGGEAVAIDVGGGADFGGGEVATCFGEFGGLCGRGIVGSFDEVVGLDAGVGE
jgi:hypothetical protein